MSMSHAERVSPVTSTTITMFEIAINHSLRASPGRASLKLWPDVAAMLQPMHLQSDSLRGETRLHNTLTSA